MKNKFELLVRRAAAKIVGQYPAPALGGTKELFQELQAANVESFAALQKSLPQFNWQHGECPIYRGNFSLIGQNTHEGQSR